MKIQQSRPEFYSRVARVSKSQHQPSLKDLIQAHFRGIGFCREMLIGSIRKTK